MSEQRERDLEQMIVIMCKRFERLRADLPLLLLLAFTGGFIIALCLAKWTQE